MKKILLILLTIILLSGCTESENSNTYTPHKQTTYLGVITDKYGDMVIPLNTDVFIITTNDKTKDEMIKDFNNTVVNYHKLFDSHHDYENINNIKTINDNYGKEAVKVDKEIIEILKSAIKISNETDGYFNPTMGSISDVWKDLFNEAHINSDPDSLEVESAMACVLSNDELSEYIVIDETNSTVELKKLDRCSSRVEIDLGAYSKGYVLDKAYESLLKFESGFMLSAGSSSIITYVPDNAIDLHFSIGITNPNNTSDMLEALQVDNKAISSSGDYQQYFINEEGVRRHHILNPFTGYSENTFRGITLIADSNGGLLDALSTSIYSLKEENVETLIQKMEAEYKLNIEKILIQDDENGSLKLNNDKSIVFK